jgi:hypothetical protein
LEIQVNQIQVTIDESGPALFQIAFGTGDQAELAGPEEERVALIQDEAFELVHRAEVRPLPCGTILASVRADDWGHGPLDGEIAQAIAERILA